MKIHVIATGEFGQSTAERFAQLVRQAGHVVRIDSYLHDDVAHESIWPHADLRVLIAWRDSHALIERVDRVSMETGVPYTVAVFSHPRLRIGPTIIPRSARGIDKGAGCFRCHQARLRQHGALDERSKELFDLYDANPGVGPSGFLTHHTRFAAATLADITAQLEEHQAERVRNVETTFNVLSNGLARTTLVPVHGCSRCGSTDSAASWSSLAVQFPAPARSLEAANV